MDGLTPRTVAQWLRETLSERRFFAEIRDSPENADASLFTALVTQAILLVLQGANKSEASNPQAWDDIWNVSRLPDSGHLRFDSSRNPYRVTSALASITADIRAASS
jgi:hypothetical protein